MGVANDDRAVRRWFGRGGRVIRPAIVIGLLAVGFAAGGFTHHAIVQAHPRNVLLLQPTAIAQVTRSGPVALKGHVAEIYGGKFILQDDSGRSLVDTGPRGDRSPPVAKDETVTVQGYFDHGFLHADVLIHADGRSEAFGPPGPPPPHRHGPPSGFDRAPGPGPDLGVGPDSERVSPPFPPAPPAP